MTTQSAALERLVQDALSESWQAFKQDPVLYILANLVASLVLVVSLGLLSGPMAVGLIGIVRRRRRGEAAGVGDVFEGFSSFGAAFLAGLVVALGIFVGSLLLVLPGLVFAFFCAFTFHGIAYRKLSSLDAVKASFSLVKAHALPVAAIFLIVLLINSVGGLVWLGWLLTGPFSAVLLTVTYEKLSGLQAG